MTMKYSACALRTVKLRIQKTLRIYLIFITSIRNNYKTNASEFYFIPTLSVLFLVNFGGGWRYKIF